MATVSCPGCFERDARIAALELRVAELEALVRDLTARLGPNANNSSLPPSANPPQAPKPVVKTPTGKKPGAQPGHPAHRKRRLPPERLQRTVPFLPERCRHCQAALPSQPGPDDPEPTWHQVAELPETAAQVTEYQGHFRTCPGCGRSGLLRRLSPRQQARPGRDRRSLVRVPLALGTVSHLESQMSAALAAPHTEALEAMRQAEVKHVDETGWKQAGQKRWLWLAATTHLAVFLIHARRSFAALRALLGSGVIGYLCSDRWSVYDK
jgi:transposase